MRQDVVLGLSGGVDSAVAAHLLQKAGYAVHGLYLETGQPGGAEAAREAAENLGIPLTERDVRPALEKEVCSPFAAAYLAGQTPSPCVLCNPAVKFRALLEAAKALGGGAKLATGHYAAVRDGALWRGRPANDQSYMLCRLKPEQVRRLVLPLGPYEKGEVRALARELGLAAAEKPDSMEICFIPDGDYAAWLERRCPCPPPGDFLRPDGTVLGRHKGLHHYTVGQRRGLGVAVGVRLYVTALDAGRNAVILGEESALWKDAARTGPVNWLLDPPPAGPFRAFVKVRHSKGETPAQVIPEGEGLRLEFDHPVRAPVPGQAAAGYDGEGRLLFGAFLVP